MTLTMLEDLSKIDKARKFIIANSHEIHDMFPAAPGLLPVWPSDKIKMWKESWRIIEIWKRQQFAMMIEERNKPRPKPRVKLSCAPVKRVEGVELTPSLG